MKISEDQKRENRKKIIRSAVNAITQKGMKGATMRDDRPGKAGVRRRHHL